jgi:flavin-dependent dehydrogenase
VIYREEEVARVLIHELLHAACTDNMEDPVELIEAKTETWAELFLVAILANAKPRKALSLWKVQSQWIADQEYILIHNYGIISPSDYAWRYTVGRRKVLEGLGIDLPKAKPSKQSAELSLRFTNPSLSL